MVCESLDSDINCTHDVPYVDMQPISGWFSIIFLIKDIKQYQTGGWKPEQKRKNCEIFGQNSVDICAHATCWLPEVFFHIVSRRCRIKKARKYLLIAMRLDLGKWRVFNFLI